MKLNSIQANEVTAAILRPPEKNDGGVDAGRRPYPEFSASSTPRQSASPDAQRSSGNQAQALSARISYVKEQLDKILVEFPPFFPAGSYQRIDLIKGIRGIQDQVEKSSVQSKLKEEISSNKLSDSASDSDISVALDQLLNLKDDLSQSLPTGSENHKPGTLVSIKV